jgi:hypothetical protein
MDLDRARRMFASRYHKWAVDERHREVRSNFARLRRIRGSVATDALLRMSRWTEQEKLSFLLARLAQAHADVGPSVAAPTPDQQRLLDEFTSREWYERPESLQAVLTEEDIRKSAAVADIRGAVKAALEPLLGRPKTDGASLWRYRTIVDGFTLCTEVGVHRFGVSKVYYHHVLHEGERDYWPQPPHATKVYPDWISFALWIGLGQSMWDRIRKEHVDETAETIKEFCGYFLSALPKLLVGDAG